MFAMPKFMYWASVLKLDSNLFKTVNSLVYNFLWKWKDKIKHLAIIGE